MVLVVYTMCILIYRRIYLHIWFILIYSSTYQYILRYTMSIALYAMFSFKKRFAKLCIISGNRTHDLMHTARLRWPLHHQRLCRHKFVPGISLSARTRLHCGKNVTLRLVSDIWRGAYRATRTGHGVTSLGLPGPGPDSEVRALRLRLRRPVTGLGAGAAISACGPA